MSPEGSTQRNSMPFVPESCEAVRAFLEAEDISVKAGQVCTSGHVLLALFTFANRAQVLLHEHHVDADVILAEMGDQMQEGRRTVMRLRDRAREIAVGTGAAEVDCLHVLIALTRLRNTFGYCLLQRAGTSITALRNIAVSYVTGNLPRRYRELGRSVRDTGPFVRTQTRSELPRGPVSVTPEVAVPLRSVLKPAVVSPIPDAGEHRGPPSPGASAARVESAKPRGASPKAPLDEVAPTLALLATDLTAQAAAGGLDMVLGRDHELEMLVDILGKRRANNPVLVGPPGVGKTAIVEGFAVKIARGEADVSHFHGRYVVALDTGSLVAGTSLRGSFSERLAAIKTEVALMGQNIIVFIDEVHRLIGAGSSGDGAQDAANELKTALARGEFPCIGATTEDEYKKYIEKDPALERRFTPIQIAEPSPDETIAIVEGGMAPYAAYHQVAYAVEALHAAVLLSHRFVTERRLPDKAFAVLDLAGSRARRRGEVRVGRLEVAQAVHEMSGVSVERLLDADGERLAQAEESLGACLVGHRSVIKAVCDVIRRGMAGFHGKRPLGSLLFLGPTGVGKTELVKILAGFLFGRRDAIVRFDMSELSEKHAVARLVGAQPGYVGYEEGGQLTEALRKRPFQIVLFDEMEKAHPDVLNLLLQILDEGHLSDSRGHRVSFANAVVVLTSNLGAAEGGGGGRPVGFERGSGTTGEEGGTTAKILRAAQAQLPSELWGRLDERLVFAPLSCEQVREVASLQLRQSAETLLATREITLSWHEPVLDALMSSGGYSPETGARGMRQAIQRHIEAPIAERILRGTFSNGDCVALSLSPEGKIRFVRGDGRRGKPDPLPSA